MSVDQIIQPTLSLSLSLCLLSLALCLSPISSVYPSLFFSQLPSLPRSLVHLCSQQFLPPLRRSIRPTELPISLWRATTAESNFTSSAFLGVSPICVVFHHPLLLRSDLDFFIDRKTCANTAIRPRCTVPLYHRDMGCVTDRIIVAGAVYYGRSGSVLAAVPRVRV